MCNLPKQGARPPHVQCRKEPARPTLKGSPGPTVSPDWEPLKDIWNRDEPQTGLWIHKTRPAIPAPSARSPPPPAHALLPAPSQAAAWGPAIPAQCLAPLFAHPGVLSWALAAAPPCPPHTDHHPSWTEQGAVVANMGACQPGPLETQLHVRGARAWGWARQPGLPRCGVLRRRVAVCGHTQLAAPGGSTCTQAWRGRWPCPALGPGMSLSVGSPSLQVGEIACSSCACAETNKAPHSRKQSKYSWGGGSARCWSPLSLPGACRTRGAPRDSPHPGPSLGKDPAL